MKPDRDNSAGQLIDALGKIAPASHLVIIIRLFCSWLPVQPAIPIVGQGTGLPVVLVPLLFKFVPGKESCRHEQDRRIDLGQPGSVIIPAQKTGKRKAGLVGIIHRVAAKNLPQLADPQDLFLILPDKLFKPHVQIPAFLLAPRRLPAKEHFLFFRVHRTKGKHGGSGQRFDLLQRIPGAAVKIRFCPEEALDYRPLQFGKPVECPLHRIRLQKPDQADQRVRILFPSAADHMPDRLDQFNIIARMEKVKREIKIGNYFYRAGQHAERLLHMSASAQLIQQPYRGSQEDTVHRIQILVLQKASRLKNSQ